MNALKARKKYDKEKAHEKWKKEQEAYFEKNI